MRRIVGTGPEIQIDEPYRNELLIAERIARDAGREVLRLQGKELRVRTKAHDQSVVTNADCLAHDIICSGLRAAFPDDTILSEEDVDTVVNSDAARLWVVDPLDGTTGLIDGSGEYAIQIGLVVRGRVVLGVVNLPTFNSLYTAVLGFGSWVDRAGSEPRRIYIPARRDGTNARAVSSRSHRSSTTADMLDGLGFRDELHRHSVGVKVATLLAQQCDVYIHPSGGTKWWDTCAPEIILTEAGGTFTDLFGRPLVYSGANLENTSGLLATCGIPHDAVVSRLAPLIRDIVEAPLRA